MYVRAGAVYNLKQFIFVYDIKLDPVCWLSYILSNILRVKLNLRTKRPASNIYTSFDVPFVFLAPCSLANASGPKARFWGGKARRGLRKNLDQIRSLKNGDPEISLKRYDVASSDYPWFDYPSRQGRWNISVALPYALWEQL